MKYGTVVPSKGNQNGVTDEGPSKISGSPSLESKASRKSARKSSMHTTSRSKSPHRSVQKPKSISTMSTVSTVSASSKSNMSGDDLGVSERSHRKRSSRKPRSKSTMSSTSDDNLAVSERSHGKRRSSQRARSKSTMSASSGDNLAVSSRSHSHKRRSTQKPRSMSTMSSSSQFSESGERSSDRPKSHRSSTTKSDRESKRKSRLNRSSAAPGAFQASSSDDDDDVMVRSERRPRSSRQSKIDKEAKRRARSLSLSDFSESDEKEDRDEALKLAGARYGTKEGPGVYSSNQPRSRESRKIARQSKRGSSQDVDVEVAERRSRELRKSDRQSTNKRRSSQEHADEIAKRRSNTTHRAHVPGAQSTSIDMAARKSRRHHSIDLENQSASDDEEQLAMKLAGARYRGKNTIGTRMAVSNASTDDDDSSKEEEGDGLIQAMIVDDENGKGNEAQGDNRRVRQAGRDPEQWRLRTEEQNETTQRAMEEDMKRNADGKRKKRKRAIVVVLLFLIISGVSVFFATQGSSKSSVPVIVPEEDAVFESPTNDASGEPSMAPSDAPSGSPSINITYDPPNAEDCENIANGIPIEVPDTAVVRNFDVVMEVDLIDDRALEDVLPELETKIERILMPELSGCPTGGAVNRRRLDAEVDRVRNVVADGIVSISISNDVVCNTLPGDNCFVVVTNLDLRLLGDERIFFILTIIAEVFRTGPLDTPLVEVLDLDSPYAIVQVVNLKGNDPTRAPSTAPSTIPSSLPSGAPSVIPTPNPSAAPFPGSTPSPTCQSIATNFDSQSFLEQSGTQDATYSVPCGNGTDMVVLRRLEESSCEVECLADLSFAVFQGVCQPTGAVSVTLAGDYSQSQVYVGVLDSIVAAFACTDTLQLESTPATSPPTIAPVIEESSPPTLEPVLEEDSSSPPTIAESSPPTLAESSLPTLAESSPPTLEPVLEEDSSSPPTLEPVVEEDSSSSPTLESAVGEISSLPPTLEPVVEDTSPPTIAQSMNPSLAPSEQPTGDPRYMGCFADNPTGMPDFFLYHHNFIPSTGSYGVDTCIQSCADMGFSYAGLQGNQCFCGNNFGSFGDATTCADTCGGLCGSENANSVYQTSVVEVREEEALPEDLSCGCFYESEEAKALSVPFESWGTYSQKTCILGCQEMGYDFAGLNNGGECWCGNSPANYGEAEGEECFMQCEASGPAACYGNAFSCDCGGSNVNRVFKTRETVNCPAPPTASPSVASSDSPSIESEPPENLAQISSATASMSSADSFFGQEGPISSSPYDAIDGNNCELTQTQQMCLVAQTSTSDNPWWEVNLGFVAEVETVEVWQGYASLDGCFVVLLASDNETILGTRQIAIGEGTSQEFDFGGIHDVRYVRVEGVRTGMVLSLAEIEIFGYPDY